MKRGPKPKIKTSLEFGDYQTPTWLAMEVCQHLVKRQCRPQIIIEPTCGTGTFLETALEAFPESSHLFGFEINAQLVQAHHERLAKDVRQQKSLIGKHYVIEQADFFQTDWSTKIPQIPSDLLVIGNLPWVTNSAQGKINANNLPDKKNVDRLIGLDSRLGKANFDISEPMLREILHWFPGRSGHIAILVKATVARKILSYVIKTKLPADAAWTVDIDAKAVWGVYVDACLLVIRIIKNNSNSLNEYTVYRNFKDTTGERVSYCNSHLVLNIHKFNQHRELYGASPQKWRSGIKHDAKDVMAFVKTDFGYCNGLNECVELEPEPMYPFLKGSEVGTGKSWQQRYVLLPQQRLNEDPAKLQVTAPKAWSYLTNHKKLFDNRSSKIYAGRPSFSIFGVGPYAFRPWKIAICSMYTNLDFRLFGPIEGKPVMFDDTVYYLSFETQQEAEYVKSQLCSKQAQEFLSSLIFWSDKRPVKASILNVLDYSKIQFEL